jgi:hypothetical protein
MSDSGDKSIGKFEYFINEVNDILFLQSLNDFMIGSTNAVPSAGNSDMKEYIITFVKERKGDERILAIISSRIYQLKLKKGGRRTTHRRHRTRRRKTHSRRKGVKRSTRRV